MLLKLLSKKIVANASVNERVERFGWHQVGSWALYCANHFGPRGLILENVDSPGRLHIHARDDIICVRLDNTGTTNYMVNSFQTVVRGDEKVNLIFTDGYYGANEVAASLPLIRLNAFDTNFSCLQCLSKDGTD